MCFKLKKCIKTKKDSDKKNFSYRYIYNFGIRLKKMYLKI